jgi:hypothetical protein
MKDTALCTFCEQGNHDHPAYSPEVCRCGCPCHGSFVGDSQLTAPSKAVGSLPVEVLG